jgi:hypothetical protein
MKGIKLIKVPRIRPRNTATEKVPVAFSNRSKILGITEESNSLVIPCRLQAKNSIRVKWSFTAMSYENSHL